MCVNARALLMSALGEGEKAEKDRPVVKYGNQESHVPATTTAKFVWVAAPPSDVTSQAGHQAASSYLRCPTLLSKYYYGQHISTQQRNKQTKFIIITTQGISHKLHSSFFQFTRSCRKNSRRSNAYESPVRGDPVSKSP